MSAKAQLATIVPAGTWLFDDERSTLDLMIDRFTLAAYGFRADGNDHDD